MYTVLEENEGHAIAGMADRGCKTSQNWKLSNIRDLQNAAKLSLPH